MSAREATDSPKKAVIRKCQCKERKIKEMEWGGVNEKKKDLRRRSLQKHH